MRILRLLPALALLLCLAPTARASLTVFDLGPANVGGSVARVPVSLNFTPMNDDELVAVSVDVLNSSDNITEGGTDFSRFSFDISMGDVATWELLDFIDPITGDSFSSALVQTFNPADFLGEGPHNLGDIVVSLNGIAPGTMVTVAIDALDFLGLPATNSLSEDPTGEVGFTEVQFANASTTFTVPERQVNVPEPASFALGVLGLAALARRRRRAAA